MSVWSRLTGGSAADRTRARDLALGHDVRRRLDELWGVRDLARYEVTAAGGRASLVGRVRSRQMARSMAEATRRVPGVTAVDDRLVADDELVTRVAAAIGRGARQRGSRLVVRAEFGRMRIGGVFASPAVAADALEIGRGVPGVADATTARATDLLA